MSKARRKKPASFNQDVQMVPSPRDPRRAKYTFWAFIIWVLGVVLLLLKWGRF